MIQRFIRGYIINKRMHQYKILEQNYNYFAKKKIELEVNAQIIISYNWRRSVRMKSKKKKITKAEAEK